jgi:hypothetical protein
MRNPCRLSNIKISSNRKKKTLAVYSGNLKTSINVICRQNVKVVNVKGGKAHGVDNKELSVLKL